MVSHDLLETQKGMAMDGYGHATFEAWIQLWHGCTSWVPDGHSIVRPSLSAKERQQQDSAKVELQMGCRGSNMLKLFPAMEEGSLNGHVHSCSK